MLSKPSRIALFAPMFCAEHADADSSEAQAAVLARLKVLDGQA